MNVIDWSAGLESWPLRVRAPAGVRKRRKATVRKRRNMAPGFKALDPKLVCGQDIIR